MTDTLNTYSARETWLANAIEVFRPRFEEIGFPIPATYRVAVGFGPTGARKENAKILGVTLNKACTDDGVTEMWISPEDADTASMLGTLVHEMIHMALDHADARNDDGQLCWFDHSGPFAEAGTRLGLQGRMSSSVPSVELSFELMTIAASLGEYPGSTVDLSLLDAKQPVDPSGQPIRSSSGPAKQGTRMCKCECLADAEASCFGYIVRTTEKWLAVGNPMCPNGHEMTRG